MNLQNARCNDKDLAHGLSNSRPARLYNAARGHICVNDVYSMKITQ